MICPDCCRPIDDHHMACAYCTNAKSYQGVLDSQKPVVGHILNGKCTLKIAKAHHETGWHILIADYAQTWCGRLTNTKHWTTKRERQYWSYVNAIDAMCESCKEMIDQVAEAQSMEAA